jgi:dTDP-4-amino-4,6-dideoxygalactose transaminase
MKPKMASLEKNLTKNTKAIILAWVYGSYNYAEEIYKFCKDKGLFIIEDNAETFFDTKYNGSPHADASLFSFGIIKLNTALGGALMIVRNNEVLSRRMKYIMSNYPVEGIKFFIKRLVKAIPAMMILNSTMVNEYARRIMISLGIEYKEKAISLLRGFQPDETFLNTYRKQMPEAMIAFLYLRMKTFDKAEFLRCTKRQYEGQQILERNGIFVPGTQADKKFYWLYPIIVPDQELCYDILNKKGIDAYLGATKLKPVPTPIGSKYEDPKETIEFFNKILYLPIHKNVPLESIQKICRGVVETVKGVEEMKRRNDLIRPKL